MVVTDAAFKKEEETGHALRGMMLMRVPKPISGEGFRTCQCHVVDFSCRRLRNVTRSTFAAELFALCEGCDHAMLLRQIAHEFSSGPLSASEARDLREGRSSSSVEVCVVLDAMSVFTAVTAAHVKIPSEQSLLGHLQFVRELLDRHVVSSITWVDTRSMTADALTKGKVARGLLTEAMMGRLVVDHEVASWRRTAFLGLVVALACSGEPDPEIALALLGRGRYQPRLDGGSRGPPSVERFLETRTRILKRAVEEQNATLSAPKWDPRSSRLFNNCLEFAYELLFKDIAFAGEQNIRRLAVALSMLTPGRQITVPMTKDSKNEEHMKAAGCQEYYHGTSVTAALRMMYGESLRASQGTGHEDMMRRYGASQPLVYTSSSAATASRYPMEMGSNKEYWGEQLTLDGTFPMRALVVCLGRVEERVVKKRDGTNIQDAFLEGDVTPVRLILLGVDARPPEHNDRTTVRPYKEIALDRKAERPWAPSSQAAAEQRPPADPTTLSGRKKRMATGAHQEKEWARLTRRAAELISDAKLELGQPPLDPLPVVPAVPPAPPLNEAVRIERQTVRLAFLRERRRRSKSVGPPTKAEREGVMADMKRLVLDAQKTDVEKRCGELLLASKSHGESSETSRQAEKEPGQAKSLWTQPAGSAKKEAAGQAESFWAKSAAPPGSQPGSSSDPKPASKASAVVLKPQVPSSERISEWRRRWGAMKRLKTSTASASSTTETKPKRRGPESVPKSTPPSGQAVESPAASVLPPPGDSESENLD